MALDERMAVAERRDVMASLITEEMGCPITGLGRRKPTLPRVILDGQLELAPG